MSGDDGVMPAAMAGELEEPPQTSAWVMLVGLSQVTAFCRRHRKELSVVGEIRWIDFCSYARMDSRF